MKTALQNAAAALGESHLQHDNSAAVLSNIICLNSYWSCGVGVGDWHESATLSTAEKKN